MPTLVESEQAQSTRAASQLPVSVIVPVRNEAANLSRCLDSLRDAGQVYVVDSFSTDATVEIARSYSRDVVQFHYAGGWPKKRQWAMTSLPLAYDWILLIDADEALTPELSEEIRAAIRDPHIDGYYIGLEQHFLGRSLRHSDSRFYKLALFRTGKGHFECRSAAQDSSMCDMEVHEHVVVDGETAPLRNSLIHRNLDSLSRYIDKHNQYSNWEAHVWSSANGIGELKPSLFGSQAQRRRWLKKTFFALPGSPLAFFLYKYIVHLGFLDGIPGLIYCGFQAVQFFHVKAKMYELRTTKV